MNLGYHFSDTTVLRAVYREFDSYTGVPGQVFYGLTDTTAWESVRDSALSVRLDDARGKRFTQKVIFGYHRNSTLTWIHRRRPTPSRRCFAPCPGRIPYTYLVALVPPSTTRRPARHFALHVHVLSLRLQQPHADRSHQRAISGNLDASRRRAGRSATSMNGRPAIISALNVSRYDNGFFISDQYALTPRIYFTASARFQQSSTFGSEFAPRGAVTFRLPTETISALQRLARHQGTRSYSTISRKRVITSAIRA